MLAFVSPDLLPATEHEHAGMDHTVVNKIE